MKQTAITAGFSRRTAFRIGAFGAVGVALGADAAAAWATAPDPAPVSRQHGEDNGMLTDVPGFLVGHATLEQSVTGCTVILCPNETTGGVEIRGGWTGTREMDILSPLSASPFVHAVLFTGGSTFGLAAADGVMRWLEERAPESGVVPQVPGAVVYDLAVGESSPRPGAEDGYRACEAATSAFDRGSVGAGVGTRVGAAVPGTRRMKGGLGSASRRFGAGGVVGALAVVNALGNVIDRDGRIVAGAYFPDGRHADMIDYLTAERVAAAGPPRSSFTTLVAVATNAALTKTQCAIVARMAQAGLARAVQPCFTASDGDVVVALASGGEDASEDVVGIIAAATVADAIRDAVRRAESRAGIADRQTSGVRSPDDPAWAPD
ncbi:MAG: P1 family peptidase [Chloroflexota bacterium]|nr:P1 family peptidase [Chloroflexota bacterium]